MEPQRSSHKFSLAGIAIGIGLLMSTVASDRGAFGAEAPCVDGVVVVVDFTDLGGRVEARCAQTDPETGRAALDAAGFTLTESQPGLICAIDSLPDPCPESFQGSYWSYWHGGAGGDWTSYQVGADSSDPAPGDVEGWRYNDGSSPPGLAPADVAAALPAPTPSVAGQEPLDGRDSGGQDEAGVNIVTSVAAILGAVALLAAIGVVVVSARRRSAGPGD